MISLVKALKVVENEESSDKDKDLYVENDNTKYIKVFEVKNVDKNLNSNETTTNNDDVDDLRKCFKKKLDLNTFSYEDEVLQISRGPQGGKPTSERNDVLENEPPSKFVRPYERTDDGSSCFQTYSMTGVVPNCCNYLPLYSSDNRLLNDIVYCQNNDVKSKFIGSKFNDISSKFDCMPAAEVFKEHGMVNVEPTHFTTFNSNYVYDKYGQIIPHNNKRKIDFHYPTPQVQNSSVPASYNPSNTIHKNNLFDCQLLNPTNEDRGQFNLNIRNLPNSTGFVNQNQHFNLSLSNGGPWTSELKQHPTTLPERIFLPSNQAFVHQKFNTNPEIIPHPVNLHYISNKGPLHSTMSTGKIPINDNEVALNKMRESQIGNYMSYQISSKTSISESASKGHPLMQSIVKPNATNDITPVQNQNHIENKGQLGGISTKRINDMIGLRPSSLGKFPINGKLSGINGYQITNEQTESQLQQPAISNSVDFILTDEEEDFLEKDLGLDNRTLESLLQEFQSDSSFDWSLESFPDEPFKEPTPIMTKPQASVAPSHEVHINSPSESFASSPHDFYYAGPNSLSTSSDYNYQESPDSGQEQLGILEQMAIHPDFESIFVKEQNEHFTNLLSSSETPSDVMCPVSSVKSASNADCNNTSIINDCHLSSENSNEGMANQFTYSNYSDEDLVRQDEDGDNILHMAVIDDKPEIIQEVLKTVQHKNELRKRIVDAKNYLSQTPLCLAVIENQPIMIKSLIECGANGGVPIMSRKDNSFTRPLHFAASKGHLWMECLRELLACQNVDVNSLDTDGRTPLLCAVKGHGTLYKGKIINSIPSVELLVKRGADLNKADGCFDMTALHFAINSKSLSLVSCLLSLAATRCHQNIPSVNNNSNTNGSQSSAKVPSGLSTLARMLIAKSGTGYSALHLAVSLNMKNDSDQLKLIQLLLSKGADPSCKNSEGHLPRELTKNQKVIELLKGIGLRRKPCPSPNEVTGSSHHSPGGHSPRSVTSNDRMTSTSDQLSPSNHIPSPIHHVA